MTEQALDKLARRVMLDAARLGYGCRQDSARGNAFLEEGKDTPL